MLEASAFFAFPSYPSTRPPAPNLSCWKHLLFFAFQSAQGFLLRRAATGLNKVGTADASSMTSWGLEGRTNDYPELPPPPKQLPAANWVS
jgi:hypothetical protein